MKSSIVMTQEAIPEAHAYKVEVHEFELTAKIPTVIEPSGYILYNILGHGAKDIVVSPNGGVVSAEYFKLMKNLRTDKGEGGCFTGERDSENRCKHTAEDTERFWVMRNQEFLKELEEMGWMVFPEVEKIEERVQKELGVYNPSSNIYGREFSLTNLIKILGFPSYDGKEIKKSLVDDFKELQKFGDKIGYVYAGGDSFSSLSSFFYMPVEHKEKEFILKLDELSSTPIDSDREYPMARNVIYNLYLSGHSDRPEKLFARNIKEAVIPTLYNYMRAKNMSGRITHDDENRNLQIITDSRQLNEGTIEQKTRIAFDYAIDIGEKAEILLKIVDADYKKQKSDVLEKLSSSIGISNPEA